MFLAVLLSAITALTRANGADYLKETVRDFETDDFPAEYVIMSQVCLFLRFPLTAKQRRA